MQNNKNGSEIPEWRALDLHSPISSAFGFSWVTIFMEVQVFICKKIKWKQEVVDNTEFRNWSRMYFHWHKIFIYSQVWKLFFS